MSKGLFAILVSMVVAIVCGFNWVQCEKNKREVELELHLLRAVDRFPEGRIDSGMYRMLHFDCNGDSLCTTQLKVRVSLEDDSKETDPAKRGERTVIWQCDSRGCVFKKRTM